MTTGSMPAQRGRAISTLSRANRTNWLPVAWVALFFVSRFKVTAGRNVQLATEADISPEIAVEVAIYLMVGIAAAAAWLRWRPIGRQSWGLRLLVAFAVLAPLSGLWSIIPLFSFVRGGQVLVVALLSAVTIYSWRRGLRSFQDDWRRIWLTFLVVVVLLGLSGLVWTGQWAGGRFAWEGVHTNTAASFLAAAGIVAISMFFDRGWGLPERVRRLLPLAMAFVFALLLLTVTRSAWAGFVVGGVLTYATVRSIRLDRRALVLAVLAAIVFLVGSFYSAEVVDYVLRGQTVSTFASVSGRTDVWNVALDRVAEQPFLGFGYGAGRIILIDAVPWAGTSHNLWISVLLSLGVVGVTVVSLLLGWVLFRAVSIQRWSPGPHGNLAIGLVTFIIINGVAQQPLALPGEGLTAMGLLVAALSVGRFGSSP